MIVVDICEECDVSTDKILTTFRLHSFVAGHEVQVLTDGKESLDGHRCGVLVNLHEVTLPWIWMRPAMLPAQKVESGGSVTPYKNG
jgi:hypothetical protein